MRHPIEKYNEQQEKFLKESPLDKRPEQELLFFITTI